MPKTDKNGRCIECGCIPRPDIARAMNEKHCRCDVEFNYIYDGLQRFLQQNDKNIESLAKSLLRDKDSEADIVEEGEK